MLKIGMIIILIHLSLIHSINLDPLRNLQVVASPSSMTGKHSLKSFHGTYLSGKPDGTITLSYNVQDWEIWTYIASPKDISSFFYCQSSHGTYLSAR